MGYSRIDTPFPNLGKVYRHRGYSFKLCPYSTEYREKYKYSSGFIYGFDGDGNPLRYSNTVVVGNTTNSDLQALPYSGYQCSDHTTTSGYMEYHSDPPGWICNDPNCLYHTTLASGKCYIEI